MSRKIITASLEPILNLVQPTSFPDVGHGLYTEPNSKQQCLIIDTPQSIANHLEAVTWNPHEQTLVPELKGLPYVEIVNKPTKQVVGSSITLPHRLGTGYIAKHKESKLAEILKTEIAERGLYPTVFKYDPNSIVHGCFFSHLGDGSYKIPRIITGKIEAKNVVAVPVGGASKDPLTPSGDWDLSNFNDTKKASSAGLGNLPYHNEEYACQDITATFVINESMIAATGLPKSAQQLLLALSEWKILKFLDSAIRLRTTEYECGKVTGKTNQINDLESQIAKSIADCQQQKLFADPVVTSVIITLKKADKKSSSKKAKKEDKGK